MVRTRIVGRLARRGGTVEYGSTAEPVATADAETMRAPAPGRRKPPSKPKPAWEVAGYRGLTPAQVGRSQTPQKSRAKQQLEESGAAPPRVYGLHTSVSQEKSTKGALEAELRRQAEWRASTVPNLSRSFASVSGAVDGSFAELHDVAAAAAPATPGGAEDAGGGVEASPTLSVASSIAGEALLIPPERHLAKSVSTLVVKLRSLSYGTSGQDPVRIFRHYDRNNRGGLDQRDFTQAVRKGGALTRSQISDTEVRLLFKAVDKGTPFASK
jgi:hypothetical protein